MHNAPVVSVAVTRNRLEGRLWLGVVVLTLSGSLLWIQEAQAPDWRLGVFVGTVLLSLAWGLWVWRHAPQGDLAWDGQSWAWCTTQGECLVVPRLRLDFQSVMLLELRIGPRRSLWLWLQQSPGNPRWADLRRALHAKGAGWSGGDGLSQGPHARTGFPGN